MDTPESGSRFGGYMRANRAFFVFLAVIVLSVFGYFWWRSGFTLDFNRFFASCSENDCDDDGILGPPFGDDCNDGDPSIGGGCPAGCVNPNPLTCGDGDCDDDGVGGPPGGDDCNDAECSIGGGCAPQTHMECQSNSCVQVSGGGSDACSSNADCAPAGCNPTNRICNGDNVFQNYSNCNGENIESCANGCSNGACNSAPPACACAGSNDPTRDADGDCIEGPPFGGDCNDGSCSNTQSCPICDNNGFCEANETQSSCPADCTGQPTPTPSLPPSTGTPAPSSCSPANIQVISYSSDGSSATVRNNSGSQCTVGLNSCKVFDRFVPEFSTTQELHEADSIVLGSGQQGTLGVGLPGCSYQSDLFTGGFPGCNGFNGGNFIDARIVFTSTFCDGSLVEDPTPTPTPPLSHNACQNNACVSVSGGGANQCTTTADCSATTHTICQNNACVSVAGAGVNACATAADCAPLPALSCSSTLTQANIGQAVPFTATGGTGSFSWFAPGGTPGTGGGASFQTAYGLAGFKTVTVVSGGQQASCTVTIIVPTGGLVCAPSTQNALSGSPVRVSASGGTLNYTWSAPGGSPPSQTASTSFRTAFTVTGVTPQTFPITVTDAVGATAVCSVNISCVPPVCPAPPAGCAYQGGTACACGQLVCPSGAPIVCAPVSQTVSIGQTANFVVGGGTGSTVTWSAPGGSPPSSSGTSTSFSTAYSTAGTRTVTVTRGGQSATCTVLVGSPTLSPTPSPTAPALTIAKTVRNVTTNGSESETATADPGHTIEFTLRVSSTGNGTATQVIVRDALPAGLNYQAGTTTIDGVAAADGITGSGISLGNLVPGRTVIVRFRVVIADAAFFSLGSTTLLDTAFARASNVAEVSDIATVVVTRTQGLAMTVTKLGRNVTQGELTEHTPVLASPGDTIEFVIRVRNTSAVALTNILVRDVLPPRITFIAGTVRLNGQVAADTLTTSGLPIATLAAGAEAVITFSGRVALGTEFPVGTVTLINTVQATASSVPMMQAQLPVIITQGVVVIPTGPGESTLLALIISAVITLLYVGYTSSESFRRREASGLAGAAHDAETFDFKR